MKQLLSETFWCCPFWALGPHRHQHFVASMSIVKFSATPRERKGRFFPNAYGEREKRSTFRSYPQGVKNPLCSCHSHFIERGISFYMRRALKVCRTASRWNLVPAQKLLPLAPTSYCSGNILDILNNIDNIHNIFLL